MIGISCVWYHSLTTSNKNQPQLPYHTLSPVQTLDALNASSTALSQTEGERRLQQYGCNELASDEKRSLFMRFIDQFKDLMIVILLVAALLFFITQGTEGMTDAIIILAVVVLNAMMP